MKKPERIDVWLLTGILAFSLTVRIAFSLNFDGLYGQDAYAYYNFAGQLLQASSQHTWIKPFFWPLGYPALLALGFALFGTSALTAQAINLMMGALLAPLVYVLARQLGVKPSGALAAGVIMGICGQAIQSSIVVMADIPALFWATLSAVVLLRFVRTERRRWLVLAGLALGFACVTRWLYLALIPVWGAVLLLAWRQFRWRDLLVAGIALIVVLMPQASFSIHSPYPMLDHPWVTGWSPANLVRSSFDNADGHFDYAQVNALFYAQPYANAYYLAPLFTPFLLVGIWVQRKQPHKLVILAGWVALPYLFLAGIPYQNIRFALIVVPAVAVLVGIGFEALFGRWRAASVGILIIGLVITGITAQPTITDFVARQNYDKAAVQWAIQHIPADALLYAFGLTQPLQAYATFTVRELYNETPQTISLELGDSKPRYLFTNIWVIENQWTGRMLETTYHWLRDEVGLEYLDRTGNYMLFRVQDENWSPDAGVQRAVG